MSVEQKQNLQAIENEKARKRINNTHKRIQALYNALKDLEGVVDMSETYIGAGKYMNEYIQSSSNKLLTEDIETFYNVDTDWPEEEPELVTSVDVDVIKFI